MMKTDQRSQSIITTVIVVVILSLSVFIGCESNRVNAHVPEDTIQEKQWYEEALRAYNHLLHRVWIDRPNYVEDCLVECDEFVTLDSLMNHHWEDTFEFYNERDSIDYHNNWFREHSLDPGCTDDTELPERVTSMLYDVFGNGD